MKKIRYKDRHWRVINDDESVEMLLTDGIFSCEKVSEWREVESGVWNPKTGLFDITLKPNVPSLIEAAEEYIQRRWPDTAERIRNGDRRPFESLINLVLALDREKAKPQRKYTDEAVDEFLDAAKVCNEGIDKLLTRRLDYWEHRDNIRAAKALHALVNQRDAKE